MITKQGEETVHYWILLGGFIIRLSKGDPFPVWKKCSYEFSLEVLGKWQFPFSTNKRWGKERWCYCIQHYIFVLSAFSVTFTNHHQPWLNKPPSTISRHQPSAIFHNHNFTIIYSHHFAIRSSLSHHFTTVKPWETISHDWDHFTNPPMTLAGAGSRAVRAPSQEEPSAGSQLEVPARWIGGGNTAGDECEKS